MYKIMYIKTGHVFVLPEVDAKELKEKFPEDYKILEKNGKKYRDKIVSKQKSSDNGSIYSLVVEEWL